MSIRDALALRNKTATLASGLVVTLRRPSALDLVEAVQMSATEPTRLHAWMVWRHLLDGSAPAFASIDEVLASDAFAVQEIAQEVEKLYAEGRD